MAFGGRMKSTIPLVSKLLRSEALATPRGSLSQKAPISELSRNYATATETKEAKVKLPLPMFGVDGNYAAALYTVATKKNVLGKVESEFREFVEASKKSPRFTEFAKDPTVRQDVRVKAMESICAEAKFSDTTKNFLLVVASNGRFKILENILKKFSSLTMEHRGEVKAIVTSIVPLAKDEETELKEILQEKLKGKKIILEQKIDPNILGGLVVEFNQKLFDTSIRTRARQMERFLRDPANSDII